MARVVDESEEAIRRRSATWVARYATHRDDSGARQPARDRALLIEIVDRLRHELETLRRSVGAS